MTSSARKAASIARKKYFSWLAKKKSIIKNLRRSLDRQRLKIRELYARGERRAARAASKRYKAIREFIIKNEREIKERRQYEERRLKNSRNQFAIKAVDNNAVSNAALRRKNFKKRIARRKKDFQVPSDARNEKINFHNNMIMRLQKLLALESAAKRSKNSRKKRIMRRRAIKVARALLAFDNHNKFSSADWIPNLKYSFIPGEVPGLYEKAELLPNA